MTLHPKYQGSKYRLFRALMFVATGLCGVAPLIHGLNVFGMSQMTRKALPYTLAKAGCLLSGTWFYAVSLPFLHTRERLTLTHGVLRPGFPKVAILANSTYGAPIRSFTSWLYAPLWSS
jgi:predicted membrane channel-forming protein YqfA (hemolysin III family)